MSRSRAPFLHNRIARLSARAGITKPRVYVIQDSAPNACAVGLSADDAAVAVTTGLLKNLDENEIEAVLAHEIGHIQKGHSVAKTKVALKALAIITAADTAGQLIATSDMDFTPRDDDSDDLLSTLLKLATVVGVTSAGDAVASNILSASAFRSEFEADDCGAELSRRPWALANALRSIEELTREGGKAYKPEVSQLFIVAPAYLHHQSHPPTLQRIERLSAINERVPVLARLPTIFCSSCGEKTDADGNYCYWCGGELDTAAG